MLFPFFRSTIGEEFVFSVVNDRPYLFSKELEEICTLEKSSVTPVEYYTDKGKLPAFVGREGNAFFLYVLTPSCGLLDKTLVLGWDLKLVDALPARTLCFEKSKYMACLVHKDIYGTTLTYLYLYNGNAFVDVTNLLSFLLVTNNGAFPGENGLVLFIPGNGEVKVGEIIYDGTTTVIRNLGKRSVPDITNRYGVVSTNRDFVVVYGKTGNVYEVFKVTVWNVERVTEVDKKLTRKVPFPVFDKKVTLVYGKSSPRLLELAGQADAVWDFWGDEYVYSLGKQFYLRLNKCLT